MIIYLTEILTEFIHSKKTSGIILVFCTITSISLSNSALGEAFLGLWQLQVGPAIGGLHLHLSLLHWINEGLMSVFFLLIGLEIEREFYVGELSDIKQASLPIVAALGGMIVPSLIYLLFNFGTKTQGGFGIPMATDIAFAVGILAILGDRIPPALKVFLTALAIMDDLGAIAIIALFYVGKFSLIYLVSALGIFLGLLGLNRMGVCRLGFYLIPGLVLWYCLLQSGVQATLAGILIAFAIPFRSGNKNSPSYQLQHLLHKPVAFIIMPLFALANTGIIFSDRFLAGLVHLSSLGIFAGLCIGKPLGIVLSSFLAIKLGISRIPTEVSWRHIIGVGFLGGIGFTMSIFITLLAFDNPNIVRSAEISILLGSILAGTVGFLILKRGRRPTPRQATG